MIAKPEDVYDLLRRGHKIDEKFSFVSPKTGHKAKNMSLGRIWFNLLLPEDFPLIDEPVDQKKIDAIVLQLAQKYPPSEASRWISVIQRHAFILASLIPASYRIDGLIVPEEIEKEKQKLREKAGELDVIEYNRQAAEITRKLMEHIRKNSPGVVDLLESGGRSSNYQQLLVTKGYTVDLKNDLIGPIKNSINDGYTPKEFYDAATEGRAGFYYKAVATEKPGYLAKKISNANANMVIDDTKRDCGTKKYFKFYVDREKKDLIIDRYYVEDGKLQLLEDPDKVVGKIINLRSPLYCKAANGICPVCYGRHFEKLGTKNIGLLAGGAVNIVYLNSLMKLRHKSLAVEIVEVDFPKILAKYPQIQKRLENYVVVNKTSLVAKMPCQIVVDVKNYNEDMLINSGEFLIIPGILDLIISENEVVTLPFDFKVKLYKPKNYEENGTLSFNYEPDELILEQDYYENTIDLNTIDRLFEGPKYITAPEMLVLIISEKLPKIDLNHIEVVVANMFRDRDNPKLPCRLTSYKNFVIYGQKKLPFLNDWLAGLGFENINKAIKQGLLSGKTELNPLTKLILENYKEEE